ncbi:hypothetical protein BT96DRAFT_1001756 [Gymnopus androsaceus JB14]|uniref:Ribonuclease H1 N-terminal domain-containing protein n=1 Tax=Gymnopus androsaceus JB14 TaxID=1447944 RepID=A0A6A4H0X2_9AGAR|nr:hypothetical protein BT96DRAFT_1001756 [Gymnopus androsaceus JB14]
MAHRRCFHARIKYNDDAEADITIECHNNMVTTTVVFRPPATPDSPSQPHRSTSVSYTTHHLPQNPIAGSPSLSARRTTRAPSCWSTASTTVPATPSASLSPPSTPLSLSTSSSRAGSTYPVGIPHPDDITQPMRSGRHFYVVFAGFHVGIFGDWWTQIKAYMEGVSGSHQKYFSRFDDALAAY